MSGFPLTQTTTLEVLLAVSSGEHTIAAKSASPGWYVISEFPVSTTAEAGIEAFCRVSQSGVSLNFRLVDSATLVPIDGSELTVLNTSPVRVRGEQVSLPGGGSYQLQAECIGSVNVNNFAVIQAAAVSN